MGWLCFAGVDPPLPAPLSWYLPGWAIRESAPNEEVGTFSEQVLARAAGAEGAEDAERRSSRPGMILI